MKLVLRTVQGIVLFCLIFPVSSPVSAETAEKLAATVPVEIAEIVNGGTWSEDGQSGYYRAILVTPGAGAPAQVVVQLLMLENEQAVPKVTKAVLIKEIAEQGFPNAFLAMDAEIENDMTLIVTSYGTEQDKALQFKFDGKGNYEVVPVTAEGADAGTENAPKN